MLNIKKHLSYLTFFLSGQFLIQFLNLLNGFFLLRWLSVEEQAKFSVGAGVEVKVSGGAGVVRVTRAGLVRVDAVGGRFTRQRAAANALVHIQTTTDLQAGVAARNVEEARAVGIADLHVVDGGLDRLAEIGGASGRGRGNDGSSHRDKLGRHEYPLRH